MRTRWSQRIGACGSHDLRLREAFRGVREFGVNLGVVPNVLGGVMFADVLGVH